MISTLKTKRAISGYIFIFPALIVIGCLIIYPFLQNLINSFYDWNWIKSGMEVKSFIGFDNYLRVFKDNLFWNALWNTISFSGIAVGIEFLLGLFVAVLLNRVGKGSLFFRIAVMFPLMISDIVAALTWKMLLDPSLGPINTFLTNFGLPSANWLGNPSLVIPVLAIVDAWWQTGNITIILLAGLQSMPKEPIEMAQIDGANRRQIFRFLTWPHLLPFVRTAILFRVVDLMKVFALSWGITRGGPGRASEVSQLYIYTQGMGSYLDMGYAASLAVTFSIFVIAILIIINSIFKGVEES